MTVKTMDPDEKKRIANEKRLKAVRLWNKNNTVKNVQQNNNHVIFDEHDSTSSSVQRGKPKLFDSDEEDEAFEDSFKKRPQFDGPRGQKLLEMSSQFSERFKLDERFLEDENGEEQIETQNSEADKNIQILQSVLGYSISSKSAEKSLPNRKRQIRFDPEDENASKYIKVSEKSSEPKKAKKIKDSSFDQVSSDTSIPISTERYIEVSSNLKEILSEPVGQFSLSQKFNESLDVLDQDLNGEANYDNYETELIEPAKKKVELKKEKALNSRETTCKSKIETFFILEGDPKLKEGIEFFKRPKPLEDIRKEWNQKRERVLEVFRRKKRSIDRSSSSRAKSSQTYHFSRRKHF